MNVKMIDNMTFANSSLTILGQDNKPLGELKLAFSINAQAYSVEQLDRCVVGYVGKTQDPRVQVLIQACEGGCRVELQTDFPVSGRVSYFTGSRITAQYGRCFIPDADCRIFEISAKEDFYWTNSGMILQKKVNKDGLWMIAPPPHVISFGHDTTGWFGISIPEPMPVCHTHLSSHRGRMTLHFDHYSSSHDGGRLPRVYIQTGLPDSKAILDRHCALAGALGLLTVNKKQYGWWHNPLYCTWGDQCYLQKMSPAQLEEGSAIPMNEELILRWARNIREFYEGEVNYIVDSGWTDYLGDWGVAINDFASTGAFKAVLDQLKAMNFKVILWYTPFWVHKNAALFADHPEYLIRRTNGDIYLDDANRAFLDFTQPDVRDCVRGRIEFMLKELDADGFKIDMNYTHPLMADIILHDAAWGHGNSLWLNVLKFLHETAVAIKEDAFFTISGIESYLQPYASSVRLNDLFDFDHAAAWYDRAELVSRLMPDVPIDVDGWPASIVKMREYQIVSAVFGPPVTYYTEATEIMGRVLTQADKNRLASTWFVYSQAPCSQGMQLKIDNDCDRFERRDALGNLRAKAIDKTILLSYIDDRIYATANRDTTAAIRLPAGKVCGGVRRMNRDKTTADVTYYAEADQLLLTLEDAGHGILAYEINLQKVTEA